MEKQALQTAMRRRAGEALALYALWTGATWLLEGLPGTLQRPDAAGLRHAYAAIANLAIGIALAAWMIRRNLPDHRSVSLRRMLTGIAVAALAGYALLEELAKSSGQLCGAVGASRRCQPAFRSLPFQRRHSRAFRSSLRRCWRRA